MFVCVRIWFCVSERECVCERENMFVCESFGKEVYRSSRISFSSTFHRPTSLFPHTTYQPNKNAQTQNPPYLVSPSLLSSHSKIISLSLTYLADTTPASVSVQSTRSNSLFASSIVFDTIPLVKRPLFALSSNHALRYL